MTSVSRKETHVKLEFVCARACIHTHVFTSTTTISRAVCVRYAPCLSSAMEELGWQGHPFKRENVMRTSATAVHKQYLLLGTLSVCVVPYKVSVKTSRRCVLFPPRGTFSWRVCIAASLGEKRYHITYLTIKPNLANTEQHWQIPVWGWMQK